jgi:hypothetical protein
MSPPDPLIMLTEWAHVLQIDGHSMVITAVDAISIKPSKPLKAVRINVGAGCHECLWVLDAGC